MVVIIIIPGGVLGLFSLLPCSGPGGKQILAHFLQLHASLERLGGISFFLLFGGPCRNVGFSELGAQGQNLLACLHLQFFPREWYFGASMICTVVGTNPGGLGAIAFPGACWSGV